MYTLFELCCVTSRKSVSVIGNHLNLYMKSVPPFLHAKTE